MSEAPLMPPGPPGLVDQIAEVRRELALRKAVYPGFIARGKLTQTVADRSMERLQAAHDTLVLHGNAVRRCAELLRLLQRAPGVKPCEMCEHIGEDVEGRCGPDVVGADRFLCRPCYESALERQAERIAEA